MNQKLMSQPSSADRCFSELISPEGLQTGQIPNWTPSPQVSMLEETDRKLTEIEN